MGKLKKNKTVKKMIEMVNNSICLSADLLIISTKEHTWYSSGSLLSCSNVRLSRILAFRNATHSIACFQLLIMTLAKSWKILFFLYYKFKGFWEMEGSKSISFILFFWFSTQIPVENFLLEQDIDICFLGTIRHRFRQGPPEEEYKLPLITLLLTWSNYLC